MGHPVALIGNWRQVINTARFYFCGRNLISWACIHVTRFLMGCARVQRLPTGGGIAVKALKWKCNLIPLGDARLHPK